MNLLTIRNRDRQTYATILIASINKKHLKNVGPIRHASRRTPIQQVSLPVLSRAACASMSTTPTTTTTTTRDRGDRYGPMEWAQWMSNNGAGLLQRWRRSTENAGPKTAGVKKYGTGLAFLEHVRNEEAILL